MQNLCRLKFVEQLALTDYLVPIKQKIPPWPEVYIVYRECFVSVVANKERQVVSDKLLALAL